MTIDETQPIDRESILYRCSCGCDVRVDRISGGTCQQCNRVVSTKVLNNELASTMTISGSFRNLSENHIEPVDDYDPNLLIGQRFGHYEIVQPLGSGGSGFVFRALDTSLQRYVAVKVLKNGKTETARENHAKEVDLLLQEARAQARVAHPNIVTIYYVGREQGDPFYAMELIDGVSLSERIREGDIAFSEISDIAEQLVQALLFSFDMDIIHGDIKPSNIMLSRKGGTKLSDFGLARRASDKNKLVTGGTPNYLAPEILNGVAPSQQSDMYALGVTLFELTFGKLPIQLSGTTVSNWQQSHLEQTIEFPAEWPENLPPQWRELLKRLLAKEPEQRFGSYQELADELEMLSPTSNVIASPLPRIVATLIDWITVILFMLPFRLIIISEVVSDKPFLKALVYLTDFIPIVAYTLSTMIWKQSVGRKLMQLRVLNRFGMIPRGRKMGMRSVLRMVLPWAMASLLLMAVSESDWVRWLSGTIAVGTIFFMFVNVSSLLVSKRHKTVHDMLFETQVVIDS